MKTFMRTLVAIGVSTVALATVALPASAAHESNNHLQFAPVAASSSPTASGAGTINYIKGTSGEEPNTQWTSSFHFAGLAAGTTYTVVVRGRFAAPTVFSGICTFTSNNAGSGSCSSQFTGLQRLAVAQLRLGTQDGPPVLQATRQAVLAGPGSITSNGNCREPAQAPGSTCSAPGRN